MPKFSGNSVKMFFVVTTSGRGYTAMKWSAPCSWTLQRVLAVDGTSVHRDVLSSIGWYLLCSTHLPNLYTITCNEEIKGNAKWKNSRFEPPFRDIGVTHRVHLARWKAHCRLTISDNWTFFASSHGCGTIKQNVSKSAFSGVGHFERKF